MSSLKLAHTESPNKVSSMIACHGKHIIVACLCNCNEEESKQNTLAGKPEINSVVFKDGCIQSTKQHSNINFPLLSDTLLSTEPRPDDMMKRKYNSEAHEFQMRIHPTAITRNIINEADWINVANNNSSGGDKLKLCQKTMISSCIGSIDNADLPVLAINVNNQYCCNLVQIIYIKSEDVYGCVEYGFHQQKILWIISWLRHCSPNHYLPQELIHMIIKFCATMEVKGINLDLQYIYCAHKAVGLKKGMKWDEMKKFQDKWVTNIDIGDILHDAENIASRLDIDIESIERCFHENNVDYSYFITHTRRDLAQLLRNYSIKYGKSLKFYHSFVNMVSSKA